MKILKFILFIAIVPIVCAFGLQPPYTKGFYLKGKIEGIKDNIPLYLVQYSTGDTIAKTISRKGKFNFQGTVLKGTEYYFIRVDTALSQRRSSEFLLINEKLTLECKFSDWPKRVLTGSAPHNDYLELVELWSETQSAANQKELIKEYIVKHCNSQYVPDLIRRTDNLFSLVEREQFYEQLTPFAKESYFGELLQHELLLTRKRETIKEGTTIPDFLVTLPDGSKINAHEIIAKSEYTLIDFWASWCKPCREAVPGMKKVYDAFNKKGFNILSIAVSDKEADWREAMDEDKTPWPNARDIEDVCNDIFDLPTIPGFVLVDKEGKLISYHCSGSGIREFGVSLRGDSLFKTIEQLLNPEAKKSYVITTLSSLKIGDKVPDIPLGELASDSTVTRRLSDYKGKLVILDFWSTYCTVCIAQFPKIEKLQQEFGDKIVILPVGFQLKKGEIRNFLRKSKGSVRELKLPSVIQKPEDSLLMKLFPFWGLPFEVWIDPKGTLIGLTDHRAITTKNIETILSGEVPKFSVKKPTMPVLSTTEPFLINRNNQMHKVWGSAFAGFIDSLTYITSGEILNEGGALRYYAANETVPGFYKFVYASVIPDLMSNWGDKKIIIEPSKKTFYKDWHVVHNMDNWAYDDFNQNNVFAYELYLPPYYTIEEAYKYMINDLDRFFGVNSRIEKRNMKYLALVRTTSQDKLKATINDADYKLEGDSINFNGVALFYLTNKLNQILPNSSEIIDETNYKGNIKISLDVKNPDLASIRKQLKLYGLDLIVKEKELDRLILTDIRK